MMNLRVLVSAAVLLCAQQIIGQGLVLTAKVAQVAECRKGPVSDREFAINVHIALDAQNTSAEKILLFKDLSFVLEIKAARTRADALAGRYLITIEGDVMTLPPDAAREPLRTEFVVLEPEGRYDTTIFQQFIGTPDAKRRGSYFRPGHYWVQLSVIPVTASLWTRESYVEQVRTKWAGDGRLYSQPTTTLPFEVVIRGRRDMPACK
jgi:hypothetical protein